MPITRYVAELARLPAGWYRNVRFDVDDDGMIARVAIGESARDATMLAGATIPGLPNVHSHAFQRALAGRLERAADEHESFWTWREGMYDLAERLTPDDVESVATFLYIEMLEAGYTAVGEFHYLHNDPSGAAYATRTEMSDRLVRAAEIAGIDLTLLLVSYRRGDFGTNAIAPAQRRFVTEIDDLAAMLEALRPRARVGIAPHSLRAIGNTELLELLAVTTKEGSIPVHIHVAEQQREVDECLRQYGQRPVAWLLANAPVSRAWTLVHATHVDPDELLGIVASEAVVGSCPTTEANLGDGIFPAAEFVRAGGRLGIGSDSHVAVDPAEELRLLEYGQRLREERRSVLTDASGSAGDMLYARAADGGAQALGVRSGAIVKGRRADLVTLDLENPAFAACVPETLLDAWIFGGSRNVIRDVIVAGKQVVFSGKHPERENAKRRYKQTLQRLFAG